VFIELAGPLWRTSRKTLIMIFSVVSYIGLMKIIFYIRCYPNETIMVRAYELRLRRHKRGLFLRPTMPNAIIQTIA